MWYAACQSGLYSSADGGMSWHDAYATLQMSQRLTIASVAVSPAYAHDQTLFAGALGGVLRSTDRSRTWSVAELPSPPPFVVSILASPNYPQDGLVFAATLEDGVFRSWDRGASWASWNFGLLDLNVFCLVASPDFASDDTLYAGVESGVFRSTNGGRAWRETAFPMELGPVLSLSISPDDSADHTLCAGTETNGVYRSTDGGESWTPAGLQEKGAGIDHLFHWQRSPTVVVMLAVTHAGVYASGDAGRSWRDLHAIDVGSDTEITAATLDVQGVDAALLVGMSDGGVKRLPLLVDPM